MLNHFPPSSCSRRNLFSSFSCRNPYHTDLIPTCSLKFLFSVFFLNQLNCLSIVLACLIPQNLRYSPGIVLYSGDVDYWCAMVGESKNHLPGVIPLSSRLKSIYSGGLIVRFANGTQKWVGQEESVQLLCAASGGKWCGASSRNDMNVPYPGSVRSIQAISDLPPCWPGLSLWEEAGSRQ